jgi:hypothetical protein
MESSRTRPVRRASGAAAGVGWGTRTFVSGAGERLFGETSDQKPMRLVDTRTVGNSLAFLTYQPVRDA